MKNKIQFVKPEKNHPLRFINYFFYILIQCSWGIMQTLGGFFYFLKNIKCPHSFFHGCIVTEWKLKASLSLGLFIFVSEDPFCYYEDKKSEFTFEEFFTQLAVHEYGHTIQSLIWGPLYLFVVGITSMTWALHPYFEKKRFENKISYFAVFPENQANSLGEKVTGLASPVQILS